MFVSGRGSDALFPSGPGLWHLGRIVNCGIASMRTDADETCGTLRLFPPAASLVGSCTNRSLLTSVCDCLCALARYAAFALRRKQPNELVRRGRQAVSPAHAYLGLHRERPVESEAIAMCPWLHARRQIVICLNSIGHRTITLSFFYRALASGLCTMPRCLWCVRVPWLVFIGHGQRAEGTVEKCPLEIRPLLHPCVSLVVSRSSRTSQRISCLESTALAKERFLARGTHNHQTYQLTRTYSLRPHYTPPPLTDP